jgi:hypothetical protein
MGETSGAVVRAFSLGKPVVVSANGWFAELPDEVAVKVPVDDDEIATLAATLDVLITRPDLRAAMGSAARGLAGSAHDLARVADLYVSAFEQAAGGAAVTDALLAETAQAAAEVGIDPGSAEARELARRLADVELA